MHDELFRRVLRALVTSYFDITPMGQILNRFSNDLDQVDSILPQEYQLPASKCILSFWRTDCLGICLVLDWRGLYPDLSRFPARWSVLQEIFT